MAPVTCGSLDTLFQSEGERPSHPMAAVFGAAMREWERSASRPADAPAHTAGMQQRAERAMNVAIQREMDGLERWMVFLASVGSVGPFVGLFGTVWGIMNSFSAIAGMNNTNLAVVAPGIAEALFATAIGLVAAIPAVMAYNRFTVTFSRIRQGALASVHELAAGMARRPAPSRGLHAAVQGAVQGAGQAAGHARAAE